MINYSYQLQGLSTDTKPTSVVDGSFFTEVDTDNTYVMSGGVWVLPNNLKTVKSVTDFPAAISGVITFDNNIIYRISGTVDIGTNRIVVGIKNTILGFDRQNDILQSSTTGNMFTMDNSITPKVTLIFDNLTLKATAGTLINVSGGTTDQVTFITTTISSTVTGGTMSGVAFSMRTSSIGAFTTNGFTFTGTNTAFTLRDSSITNTLGTTFNLTSSTFSNVIRMSRNFVNISTGQTFLNATSTTVTIAGQMALNVFTGGGTYITGVTAETSPWLFSNNIGITNTLITPSAMTTMTATVGGAVPTPPNNTTTFLRGDGTFVAPSGGSGDMVLASAQTNSGVKTFLDTTMKLRNVANTFDGYFVNTNTANRVYTLKDATGTLAFLTDITGTNSGTNTGDNATNTQYSSDYRAANFIAGTNYLAPNGNGSALTGLTASQVNLGNVTNESKATMFTAPAFTGAATGASLALTGAMTSSGAGIGYATGAGGTVTQLTSRTTGVTLNKLCGNITMFSAAQAANALVTFTFTNSFIGANDFLLVQHISATNGGAWVFSTVCAAGSATISIANSTAASITSATPLRFTIIKGVTS